MNDTQTNQLGRAQKIVQFLTDHSADLGSTPEIAATLLPQLQARLQKTFDDDAIATQLNTANENGKSGIRALLEESAFHISMGLVSYAGDHDDFLMQNMHEFTISDIQDFRDSRLQQYAQSVYAKAADETIAAELAAQHNVTATDIMEFEWAIQDFAGITAVPAEHQAGAAANGTLVNRGITAVIEKIRSEMRTYRKTNRLLYDKWMRIDAMGNFGHGTSSGSVGIRETRVVAPVNYNAATILSLQNMGTVPLNFSLFLQGAAQGRPYTVPAGLKLMTSMGNLASSGDELRVHNASSAMAGKWKVTV